jgi:hypothetical protein
MPLLILLARGDVTPQGDDLRIAIERLPPPLMPPALHPFLRFECRHSVRPTHFHGVSSRAMLPRLAA